MKNYFVKKLLDWHTNINTRFLPWKGEKDAYKIWLSEIMLQQTKAEQGLKYYEKFIKEFATIKKLAAASDEKVFKMWEGLGYYSRCKNLLFTARFITKNYNGIFPDNYKNIIALKGIGKYTAAAISSFAFALPYAVVDGNVYRVLSRYFGNATPIDSTEGVQFFAKLAQELLPKTNSAIYNQAIMDIGATVCKPKLAQCNNCPLQKNCVAYTTNQVYNLPVKQKKLVIKQRQFLYLILLHKNKVLVTKRTKKDVWQNLFEFLGIEIEAVTTINKQLVQKQIKLYIGNVAYTINDISATFLQKLTHQTIKATFVTVNVNEAIKLEGSIWVTKLQRQQLPFAAIVNAYLEKEKSTIIY